LITLIGFIPDQSEKVQFLFNGQDIVNRISSDYADTPIFAGREDVEDYLKNSDLGIELQIPKTIIRGREGHVEMSARLATPSGPGQIEAAPVDFGLQIKSQLEFPRQFVEPVGINLKNISRQDFPTFHWNLLSDHPETLTGKLWIYLSMQNSQGLLLDYPLMAREMDIPVSTLWGVDLRTSRIVSLCLAILGAAVLIFGKFVLKK